MTEAEWLTSGDPDAMLEAAEPRPATGHPQSLRTKRKRQCLGLACCHLLWPPIAQDALLRRGLETLDRRLDAGEDESDEAEELWDEMNAAYRHPADDAPWFKMLAADVLTGWDSPQEVVGHLVYSFEDWEGSKALPAQVAHVMRDVVGNPAARHPKTGAAMGERTGRPWQVRRAAYVLLAAAVALATPTPDALTMLAYWLPAAALFEVGDFAYRRSG